MDRLTKLASNLYPRWWRSRYGEEFAALLEDARPGLGGALDVAKGALAMQFSTASAKRTLLAGVLAGLTIGFLASFAMTPQFASQAVIQVSSLDSNVVDSINRLSQTVMSRASLANLIRSMNLYPDERRRMPTEDVLELMRRNIRISSVPLIVSGENVPAFGITFIHPDAEVSRKVVDTFVSEFLDENIRQQSSVTSTLRVIDPANLPLEPVSPNRRNTAVIGGISGLVLSGLLAFILHRRKLQVAGAGFAALDSDGTPGMQAATTLRSAPSLLKPLLFGAAVGTFLGLAFSYTLTAQYSSRAGFSLDTPQSAQSTDTINRLTQQAFTRAELANVIRELNLYPAERANMPQEDVLQLMRQNIRVTAAPILAGGRAISGFELAFTYPDRFDAPKAVRVLAQRLIDANLKLATEQPTQPATLKLLDPASQPQVPIYPNRAAMAIAGLGAGTVLGGIVALYRRRKHQAL